MSSRVVVLGLCLLGVARSKRGRDVRTNPFVLISTQRTGSSFVMLTLRRELCDVDTETELFQHHEGWNASSQLDALVALFDGSRAPPPALAAVPGSGKWRAFYDKSRAYEAPTAFGFKWMMSQDAGRLWDAFLDGTRDVRLVFLKRDNYLKMLVSKAENGERGTTHALAHPRHAEDVEKLRRERVELDTTTLVAALDDCAKKFAQMDDLRRRAEARGSATRVVVYEDLVADRGRFDDLRAFLVEGLDVNRSGCDAHPRKEAVQIHDRPTSTYVSNWDDVRATVAASPYAYLLDRPEEQGT